MEKVHQETVIKQSIVEPGRALDPQFRVDEKGRVISEQELIERAKRLKERQDKVAARLERTARWAGKTPPEILCMELEKRRPGTLKDSTFSLHPLENGGIDVHLFGRVFRILSHVVQHSEKSKTWHITAKGALDRLKTAAVRPDVPKAVKQAEVYQEQADMLRELVRVAGWDDDPTLLTTLEALKSVKAESVRSKTEVNTLFLHLRTKLGETRCQTSQPPQPPPPQPQQKPPAAKKPRRRRPKADPSPAKTRKKATPAAPGAVDSPTT